MEPNLREKEGHEYGYAMLEQLLEIYIDSNKHEPNISVNISNINTTIIKEENSENKEYLQKKLLKWYMPT